MSKLVIDMMGSDRGSAMCKEAVRLFHSAHPECGLILVGKIDELADMKDFPIIEASDVVSMETGALEVLRKKDSSMVKALEAVVREKADGVVSAGSTGGFLSASALVLKKIPGVLRPALVTSFPNLKSGGFTTVLDVGASNANTPEELVQFALMGSIYSQKINHIVSPRVALLSNGSEEGKGSPEGKEAFHLLQADQRIRFVGNIEGNLLLDNGADVVVTDGYSGNVMLKSVEGAAKGITGLLKKAFQRNFASKMGYLLARKGLKEMKETLDPKKTGGALLLGVNGVVVKAHGNSTPDAFKNAMELAYRLSQAKVVEALAAGFLS